MSKILIRTDIHWSQYSSIIKENGDKYSIRLEHLIDSVNWSERLAEQYDCDLILDLGDFFDSTKINHTEVSALSEVKWSTIPHTYIVGNHEINSKDRELSSLNILKLLGFNIITEPTTVEEDKYILCYLPYMFEYPTLEELFPTNKKRIVFSHNDVEGVVLGGYTFDKGFSLIDISKNCELFLNGHIHAKGIFGNMINLGNLCGQNFGENNCPHNAYILDTETLDLQEYENPYSFNFYKIDCTKTVKFPKFKNNPVLNIKCSEDTVEEVTEKLKGIEDLVARKIILVPKVLEQEEIEEVDII